MRVTVSPDQIRSAFEAVKDDPSFDESRGLWEQGHPPVEMLQAMCLRPEILRAFAGFGGSVHASVKVARKLTYNGKRRMGCFADEGAGF